MSQTSVIPNYTTAAKPQTEGNRVLCLYRVSTKGQVDHTDENEADIPMQRIKCHRFAEQMGWNIIYELQEDGISGHKVRAENRDEIQKVKELAAKGKFDIFLVFMFDRIGRIADETPFVVEWLVNAGIRVWSAEEGEQRIETHTDRLLNYIRFWQADGESQKTSIRTATRMGQIVEEGHFTGGCCPYGYKLVKKGRVNKKGVALNDLEVNEDEAPVVRMIYDKYVIEGYGPQRIANHLRSLGLKNRDGKNWHPATIRGILRNLTYTGVLRSGESRSQILPELQIINPETYNKVQEIMAQRSGKYETSRNVPLRTVGKTLLGGNVFCGHCGARLCVTTCKRSRPRADGTDDVRMRYICQTKTRRHEDCNGQTGYTVHILDGMIDDMVYTVFREIGGFSQSDVIERAYQKKAEEKQALVRRLQKDISKTEKNLQNLRNEVLKVLSGESSFDAEMLNAMIKEQEAKHAEQEQALMAAQLEAEKNTSIMQDMERQYNQFVRWAAIYSEANTETKKMIVTQLFNRIEVYRDYHLKVEMNITVQQFLQGLANDTKS